MVLPVLLSVVLAATAGPAGAASDRSAAKRKAGGAYSAVLRWAKPQEARITRTGRSIILRTQTPMSDVQVWKVRAASAFVKQAHLSPSRTLLLITLKPGVDVAGQDLTGRPGVRLTFRRLSKASVSKSGQAKAGSDRTSDPQRVRVTGRDSSAGTRLKSVGSTVFGVGPGSLHVDLRPAKGGQAVIVSSLKPVPLAAFRRGNTLWIVTPKADRLLAQALTRPLRGAVRALTIAKQGNSVAIRLTLAGNPDFEVTRRGGEWRIRIATSGDTEPGSGEIRVRNTVRTGSGSLFLPVEKPGPALRLRDPETGARLVVVPVLDPGVYVRLGQRFVRLTLAPSIQGIVLEPLSDGLVVAKRDGGIGITHPRGMQLSRIPAAN